MSTSIPISELNTLNVISSSDYIPIVQNSTVTTYNTKLTTVSNWISASVQASSSISTVSASYSTSGSFSKNSITALTASSLIYPNNSSASYAVNSNNALSASWAPFQGSTAFSISSSYASASTWAISASFSSQSISSSWAPVPISASWASASLTSITSTSSSFSSQSISSSYASTANYAINVTNFIKAFGTFYSTGSLGTPFNQAAWIPYSGSYNFISASYQGYIYQILGQGGMTTGSVSRYPTTLYGPAHCWIFYMSNPLPTTNYTVICAQGGEQSQEYLALVNYPDAPRTTTAFSMSYTQGSANWDARGGNPSEFDWISLMVLHP